jgi:hypothetical protein
MPHQSAASIAQNRNDAVTNKQHETDAMGKMPAGRWLGLSANKARLGLLALLLGGGVATLAADNRAPEVPDAA